jgi:hypothetical protein
MRSINSFLGFADLSAADHCVRRAQECCSAISVVVRYRLKSACVSVCISGELLLEQDLAELHNYKAFVCPDPNKQSCS